MRRENSRCEERLLIRQAKKKGSFHCVVSHCGDCAATRNRVGPRHPSGASRLLSPDRHASANWSSAGMLSVGRIPNRTIERCKSVDERPIAALRQPSAQPPWVSGAARPGEGSAAYNLARPSKAVGGGGLPSSVMLTCSLYEFPTTDGCGGMLRVCKHVRVLRISPDQRSPGEWATMVGRGAPRRQSSEGDSSERDLKTDC